MARSNPKAGRGACPTCGERVWFRLSEAGKLTYRCEACDSSGFAEAGGAAQAKWRETIEQSSAPPPPAPSPSPAPAPAPAPASFDPFAVFKR